MSAAKKATAKRSQNASRSATQSAASYAIGDTYDLDGHALVAYPDGTVVTANGSFVFRLPGDYVVTYNASPDKPVTVAVSEPGEVDGVDE